MNFYEQLSKYYDYIFPASSEPVSFIGEFAGKPLKRLLDIACGTGNYSIELAKQGYDVTATDIDKKMVEQLNDKVEKENLKIKAMTADMLELTDKLPERHFDLAFCIGNSLVHLKNADEIVGALKGAKKLLGKDGSLVLQIINFDRIILKDIKSLPTITNDEVGLKFERFYRYERDINKVFFKTVLSVEDKVMENEIELYPLRSEELKDVLEEAGFSDIEMFGDFKRNGYDELGSYMLVIWAK